MEEEEKKKKEELERLQAEAELAAKQREEEESKLKREAEDAFAIIGDLDSALKAFQVCVYLWLHGRTIGSIVQWEE